MRAFLSALSLIVSLSSAAIAGPKEDALQLLEKWAKAFTDSANFSVRRHRTLLRE
jgi:hypothetical protein